MKNILFFTLFTCCSVQLFSQTWIRPADAAKHNGDTVNLVGVISIIKYVPGIENSAVVININEKDTTLLLSLHLPNTSDEGYKKKLDSTYLNQYVQVKGKVIIDNDSPQICINNKNQLSIARGNFHSIPSLEPE